MTVSRDCLVGTESLAYGCPSVPVCACACVVGWVVGGSHEVYGKGVDVGMDVEVWVVRDHVYLRSRKAHHSHQRTHIPRVCPCPPARMHSRTRTRTHKHTFGLD